MNYFQICIFRLVLVHKNRNLNQKSWKLILRTFILQASCGLWLRYAARFDPLFDSFLSLDCARVEGKGKDQILPSSNTEVTQRE